VGPSNHATGTQACVLAPGPLTEFQWALCVKAPVSYLLSGMNPVKRLRQRRWKLGRATLLVFLFLACPLLYSRPAQSQDAESLFSEAKAYQERGQWELAQEFYRQFLRQVPASAAGHSNLGIVYAHERKFEDAASEYEAALKIDSSLSGVYLNLGIAYFQEGRYAAATPPLERFLSRDPESRQAQELLGLCDLELDKYEDAIKMLAPLQAEGSLDVLLALSASYIRLRRMHEAEVILGNLLSSPQSNSAQVHFLMGQTYAGLNDLPHALEEFKTVSALDQSWPDISLLVGATEARLGRFQEAEADLREQLEATPRSFDALFTLGALLNKDGRLQDAIPLLLRAQEMNSRSGDIEYQLAEAYWKTGSKEAAWRAVQAAVRLDPKNGQAHYLYARIARERGDHAAAQHEFAVAESLSANKSEQDILRLSEESRNP
jgi:tetratricopeptide (TPR) repeat protein